MPQDRVFWPKYERNEYFVDRPDVFEVLERAIEASKESIKFKPIALCGLGGTGKSQIALEFFYRNEVNYRYLFWMDADTEAALQSSFIDLARMLNLPTLAATNTANPDDVVPRMIQWLQTNDGWLLAFDNADDYSFGNTSDIFRLQTKYFPKTGRGVILITTRNDFALREGLVIKLGEMKMDDKSALKLLLRKNVNLTDVDPCALEIVRELGHLPLAIDLAGACMAMEGLRPTELLENYKKDPAGYLNLEDIQRATGSAYGKTVLTVWNVSFDRIKNKDPLAASLLRSFAFLYPDDIPFALFDCHAQAILELGSAPTHRSSSAAVNMLRDFSLIRRTIRNKCDKDDPFKDTLTIHRLVQTVILLEIKLPEKLQWCERLISALRHEVPPESTPFDEHLRKTMEVYVPHVRHVVMQFMQSTTKTRAISRAISNELTSLLSPTVVFLTRQALFEGVEDLAKLAVSSSETANAPEHPVTAMTLSNLSYFYASQRNFKSAETHGRRALKIREKKLGLSANETRVSRNDLAYIYRCLDMEDDATLLYFEAAKAGDHMARKELADRYHRHAAVSLDINDPLWQRISVFLWQNPRSGHDISEPSDVPYLHEDGRIDLTPLHYAVQQREIDSIRDRVTNYELFTNVRDKDGQTPLLLAIESKQLDIVRILLDQYAASVRVADKNGRTPLHRAAENGYIDVVKLLVTEYQADMNENDGEGQTPVHLAASNGHVEVVRMLAAQLGADVNIKDSKGRTPLHLAAENGHTKVVRLLVAEFGADGNVKGGDGRTPLHWAASKGQLEVVELLVAEFNADATIKDRWGWEPLHWAAWQGHMEVLKLLVTKFGADANAKGWDGQTPLHWAAWEGYIKVVRMLVAEFGADPNAKGGDGRTPLHRAADNGHIEIVRLLVAEFGADANIVDEDDRTPLHGAAEGGHIEVVRLLVVEFGADVNAKDGKGQTSLHRAAEEGHVEVVKLLVSELGSDANAKDDGGLMPLHRAVGSGHIEIVRLLVVGFGADVNAKDGAGQTPLHRAAWEGYVEMAKLLVAEFGADKNSKDEDGRTPLHWAAEEGHVELARLLVAELDANANATTNSGWTPLHSAAQNGHVAVVRLLVTEFGVQINPKTDL